MDKLTAHAAAGYTTMDTADIYGPSEREGPWCVCVGGGRGGGVQQCGVTHGQPRGAAAWLVKHGGMWQSVAWRPRLTGSKFLIKPSTAAAGILGEFQEGWVAQGNPPVQILTKCE
jgi:hypothetical protein